MPGVQRNRIMSQHDWNSEGENVSKSAIGTVMGGHYQLALLVLAAAALFLLLAACGGDSGTVVESGGEPAATAAVGESPATEAAAAPSSGTQAPGTQSSDQQAADTPAPGAPATQATDTPAPGAPASDAPATQTADAAASGTEPSPTAPPANAPAPQPSTGEGQPTPQAGVPTSAPEVTQPPTPIYAPDVGGAVGNQAPEFSGITAWINSDPLTMEALRGQVVLVDFWTYTCINCIRTYPYLKLWNSRYSDDGLVIVGVHAPEFEFEKDYDNVVEASAQDGIVWPIAQDNDFSTWRSYHNRYWPAKYLMDKDGVVRYTHFGEGGYAETEEKIRELLLETGVTPNDENLPLPEDQTLDPTFRNARGAEVTRELYAGHRRGQNDLFYGGGGYVGQNEYYQALDSIADFKAPDEFEPNRIYLQGPWYIGPESSRHAVDAPNFDDFLALVYSARTVNAVLTSDSGVPYKVRLTVGGEYLTEENKGEDVIIGSDGESYLWVTEPKMYSIVEHPTWVSRQELKMSSDSGDFGLFAFTFGIYQKEPS